MESQTKKEKNVKVLVPVVNTCRFIMALVLMASGFMKAVDPVGSMYKLREYSELFSFLSFSDDWLQLFAILQAVVEFLLGVYMLVGVYRKVITLVTMLMMLFFTPLTFYIMLEGTVSDCGCFGDAVVLTNDATFYKNLFLLLLSVVVFWGRKHFVCRISPRTRWVVALFSLLYIIVIQGVSLSSLPVIDFRPYAIGNNLREMVQGEPDEYDVLVTYEKNGEQREFNSENLPDSTWAEIGSRSVLVKEGKPALIGDFSIVDWEYDYDITEDVLSDTGYVCLVVIEETDKASVSRVDKINDLYDHCVDRNIPFYAVSSSSDEELELWAKRTGAEYPIYWADATVLRTMVRANPALLLLKDGVIAGKWNLSDVPDIESFENSSVGVPGEPHTLLLNMRGWFFWVGWFFGPLLFIVLLDVLLAKYGKKKKGKTSAKDSASVEQSKALEDNTSAQDNVVVADNDNNKDK